MERIDEIGFGGLKLIQDDKEFCYGIDGVLLADFAVRELGKEASNIDFKAMDLCTGTGIVMNILSYKTHWKEIFGIELQKNSYRLGRETIKLNGLENRLKIFNYDVGKYQSWIGDMKGKFNVVTMNPPYIKKDGGLENKESAKLIARKETTCGLEDFIGCASELLDHRGKLFMVHRPSRLVDILCFGRKYGLETKKVVLISPKKDKPANILLVAMAKNAGRELAPIENIYVYEKDGTYSERVLEAYK